MKPQTSNEAHRQISLYYREGNSDKVYQCSIEPKAGLFVVNFAFGRRGTTLNAGTKTPVPVPYELAIGIYEKLIREKMAKGYTEGPDGTPYLYSEKQERSTGILPQLLNPVTEPEAERLIPDCRFCAQEKYDGRRVFVLKEGDMVSGINRKGLVIALPESIVKAAQKLPGDFLLDGECVGEVLYAFDVLRGPGIDLMRARWNRYVKLYMPEPVFSCSVPQNKLRDTWKLLCHAPPRKVGVRF